MLSLLSALLITLSSFSPEPLADPYTPESNIVIYRNNQSTYYSGKIGANVPVIAFLVFGRYPTQLKLSAACWVTLQYRDGAFPLKAADFLVSVPLTIQLKRTLALTLKFNHISSHLGDSLFEGVKPQPYSRDFLTLRADYFWIWIRTYIQSGYIHKIIPENLGRWFVSGGVEINPNDKGLYLAQDISWTEDTGTCNISGQFGIAFFNQEFENALMRLAITFYYGKNRQGQFYKEKEEMIGLGLFVRMI